MCKLGEGLTATHTASYVTCDETNKWHLAINKTIAKCSPIPLNNRASANSTVPLCSVDQENIPKIKNAHVLET